MKYLRSVLFGALLWVLIFFEVCVLMFGFGLKAGLTYYGIHYSLIVILVGLTAWFYFDGKVKPSLNIGLLVGLVFMAVGTLLDCAITVPLFTHDYTAFFNDSYLWIGYVEGVIICGLVGMIKKE
jgi:hypothetical protein